MKGRRIVVLASGRGTNLDAFINAINAKVLKAEIVGVASNKKGSGALQIAASQNIPTLCFVHEKDKQTREEYDDHLAQGVAALHPDQKIGETSIAMRYNNYDCLNVFRSPRS